MAAQIGGPKITVDRIDKRRIDRVLDTETFIAGGCNASNGNGAGEEVKGRRDEA